MVLFESGDRFGPAWDWLSAGSLYLYPHMAFGPRARTTTDMKLLSSNMSGPGKKVYEPWAEYSFTVHTRTSMSSRGAAARLHVRSFGCVPPYRPLDRRGRLHHACIHELALAITAGCLPD